MFSLGAGPPAGEATAAKIIRANEELLDAYGIPNTFEVYSGTHTSMLGVRFLIQVLPFFRKQLCFAAGCAGRGGRQRNDRLWRQGSNWSRSID